LIEIRGRIMSDDERGKMRVAVVASGAKGGVSAQKSIRTPETTADYSTRTPNRFMLVSG